MATHKYKEKAAVATMITATEPSKHQHNRLQSLCNAVCIEGFPEVATHKYKEKAAVAIMIKATEPSKHQHNRLQSLCNAVCTKGFPEVATHKYKEKAADVFIETPIVTKK